MGKCSGITCGREWTSLSECHCSGCHEHFRSVAAFSKHRTAAGGCLDYDEMVEKGMVYVEKDKRWVSSLMADASFYIHGGAKQAIKGKTDTTARGEG